MYPAIGRRILAGIVALGRRFGEFPTGYTMDSDYSRFDGQANGLGHHVLADGLYRNYSINWSEALSYMVATFNATAEAREFVTRGMTEPGHITHTLDLAGAAFATAQVAKHLGEDTTAATMVALSKNAINVFDRKTCLPKNSSGMVYYEGTYQNYGFRLTTDMSSRIALCSSLDRDKPAGSGNITGAARMVALMDKFFGYGQPFAVQLPITPGQDRMSPMPSWISEVSAAGYGKHSFEGLCNEPDMEAPYAYAYAARADRVQEVVNHVKAYSFVPGRGGLVGNDDSGGEAAWFVWSSIGVFPATGMPVLIIGSPTFRSIAVQLTSLDGDVTFRVIRSGAGPYIQSGTLNGESLGGRAWLWVSEAHAGGNLELTMGARPSASWGSIPPPSF